MNDRDPAPPSAAYFENALAQIDNAQVAIEARELGSAAASLALFLPVGFAIDVAILPFTLLDALWSRWASRRAPAPAEPSTGRRPGRGSTRRSGAA